MIGSIQPLTKIAGNDDPTSTALFRVVCRDCGDVTREESGFHVNDASLKQAALYQQRHLARHLTALASEVAEATR